MAGQAAAAGGAFVPYDTPWGTREFALYDVDRNALTFYRDLTSAEKERLMPDLDRPRSGPEDSMD